MQSKLIGWLDTCSSPHVNPTTSRVVNRPIIGALVIHALAIQADVVTPQACDGWTSLFVITIHSRRGKMCKAASPVLRNKLRDHQSCQILHFCSWQLLHLFCTKTSKARHSAADMFFYKLDPSVRHLPQKCWKKNEVPRLPAHDDSLRMPLNKCQVSLFNQMQNSFDDHSKAMVVVAQVVDLVSRMLRVQS